MKKSVVAVIIAVIAIAGIVAVVLANRSDEEPTTSTTQQTETQSTDQNESTSANSQPTTPPASASQTTEVEIEDFSFRPQKITVKKGSKVTWTNKDTVKHNVAPDSASDGFQAGPLLAKGESYSVTFNTVGTFAYHCEPHPNMTGTVEVTE